MTRRIPSTLVSCWAINQEAARKEKLARQALMDKTDKDDEEIGIEFEATTTIKNIGDLLAQIKEPDNQAPAASKIHH